MVLEFEKIIPVLRIFSVEKAREFYLGFLGLSVDWEHRFEPDAPLYMQISRHDLVLHLSEHHGDGCPGAVVFVRMMGLKEFHREIIAKGYRYMRPDIQEMEWGRELTVTDPFGNRIRFNERCAP
jgi:catechol 2,3-dioxygenase-like lactoylglutathione lyase family enzyme